MLYTRCEYCTFEFSGAGLCPYCTGNDKPAIAETWRELCKRYAWVIAIDFVLMLSTLFVYAAIVYGQERCPQPSQRVEYYTNDDGTQTPFVGSHTATHSYTRKQATAAQPQTRVYAPQQPRQVYRPEVRQSPFCRLTQTISARVAGKVNMSLTAGSTTASTSIGARVAGSRGDTKP